MRAMKSSGADWLGEVPSDWVVLPAKAVFRATSTKASNEEEHLTPSQKFGVLSQKDYMQISGSRVVLQSTESGNMKLVLPGDFISHLRSFQGGLEVSNIRGKVSGAYTVLRPLRNHESGYFKWLLKSNMYIQGLQTTTDQLRDGQTIRMEQIKLLPLPFPETGEQLSIAYFLDQETSQIDTLISKKEQLIERLLERRQALITHVVTKGLDPNAPMKDSGVEWLGQIPCSWETSRIGTLFEERNTQVSSLDYTPLSVTKKGVMLQLSTAAKSDATDNRKLIRAGDFAINSRSDRKGSSGLSQLEGSCSLIYTVLRPVRITGAFAHFVMKSQAFQEEFYKWGTGIVDDLWSTRYPNMKMISLPVPPVETQVLIAQHLANESAQMDTLVDKAKKAIDLLKERRQALITQVVTGKIDVRGFAGGNS